MKPSARALLAGFLVLVFFSLLPFAGALEIHHVFAEVDHDGHEHSDFDLCEWVQQHTSGSLILGLPDVGALVRIQEHKFHVPPVLLSTDLVLSDTSRGPPLLSA